MPGLPEPSRIARFGIFEVDPQARGLYKAGRRISLHEQPFRILLALLERPGEVVTREELRQRVWPGGTFVDFDSGLNTAVNKLREALGDSADSPRFIETVPRLGYRFLAPVDGLSNGYAATPRSPDGNQGIELNNRLEKAADPPQALAARTGRLWPWIAIAALAVGLACGWGLTRLRQPPANETALRVQINPPEGAQFSFGLGIGGIALSPDGRTAVFVATTNGKVELWLRPLGATEAHKVPGTEGAVFPFWSPDSKSVAFFAEGKLQRVDMSGGKPTTICDVSRGWGGAWTSDGQIIFSAFGFGLRRVNSTGGTPSPFTTLDASRGEGLHLWPQMLPGGRFLVFVQSQKREHAGVYVASLAKPDKRVLVLNTDAKALYASGGDGRDYLVWQQAGILVAQEFDVRELKMRGDVRTLGDPVAVFGGGLMNASVSGTLILCGNAGTLMQFTWFDRAGKRLGMFGEPDEYVHFRLSPDGRRAVAARNKPDGRDLWLVEADRGVANRLTASFGQKGYPVWSSNGRTILFASSAPYNLYGQSIDGGGEEHRITQSSNYQVPNDWSRGGRYLLYTEIGAGTGFDLWTLAITPDGKPAQNAQPRPYLRTQFNELNGRFSPEAEPRSIAYESDESGIYHVYVDAFPRAQSKTQDLQRAEADIRNGVRMAANCSMYRRVGS